MKNVASFRRRISKYTLITIRIDSNNNPIMSKPCLECLKVLKKCGIKRYMYINERRILVERSINNSNENEFYLSPTQRKAKRGCLCQDH